MVERLEIGSGAARYGAACVLNRLGKNAGMAVNALARALEDRESIIRVQAAEALNKIAPDARPAVPALARALRDSQGVVRAEAAMALVKMGDAALPFLIESLRSGNRGPENDTFIMALWAVGAIGPRAIEALPILIAAAEDSHPGCRNFAIEAIGRMGPAARGAIPLLNQARLNDASVQVAESAARALNLIEAALAGEAKPER
jgi:HEAT repeat protein